ncbi:MAG: adenylyltransferase/cytidyltransferase family protein [Treponema sp.]|nr:adenylyltransferase/cytidyltransferase family protein [Treponema sp.]MCR5123792.1 adenylyltransferase/cytidyltransferase family protein [Treponema sp.]
MKTGFFGGKFMPFHKGHLHCIEVAAKICDKVYVILFDSPEQRPLEHGTQIDGLLTVAAREIQIKESIKKFPNVEYRYLNTDACVDEDGKEDWDKETPLVLELIGNKFTYVFSSEPSYDAYFKRAYPWATHIIVDEKRISVPISGTEIRSMSLEEALKWI